MPNQITADITGGPDPASSARPAARMPDNLARILLRRKAIVVGVMALAVAVAALSIFTATKRYTSTARLSVKLADAPLTGESQHGPDSANYLSAQQEVSTSTSVLAIAMQDPAVAGLKALHEFGTPLNSLHKIVSAQVGKDDNTIFVSAETTDPAEAPIIAKAVVDAYIAYQTKPKESSLDNKLAALRSSREDADATLRNINVDMVDLETRFGISAAGDSENPAVLRMIDLQKNCDAADSDLLKANSDYDAARKAVPAPPPDEIPTDRLDKILASTMDEAQLHAELEQLQLKLGEMQQRYGANYPDLQVMQERVNQAEQVYVAAIGRRRDLAQARLDELKKDLAAQIDAVNRVNAETQRYRRLAEQAGEQQKIVDQYDARIRQIELVRDTGSVDITVTAQPGDAQQSSPHKAAALGAAAIVGLLLGCGLAFVRDWMDDRLHGADDVRAGLGIKLLGVVPQMPTGISPAVAAQKVALDPASDVAESYRTIRTALYFGAPKDRSKTILITSPSAGDGKTTSASNLAIAMAQAGKRVVLVDADLRHPQQHTIFATRDRIGLASLLAGHATLDQTVQATSIDNLDVLPCGSAPRNPSELLNSGTFVEVLETLAERYDQVVVDSPPVMGLADARIIAASCDLTVMVLRAQKSTRKRAILARDGLLGVGARLLGIIVNDVPKSKGEYGNGGVSYPPAGPDGASPPRLSAEPGAARAVPYPPLRRPG